VAVFSYSNLEPVDVHWSVFHVNGVPLWTVAVVPLAFVLIAGTLYHWLDGLHHFTEHMRHRRRVHELEAEVASLRGHVDHLVEMPDHSTSKLPDKVATTEPLPPAANGTADVPGTDVEPVQVASTKKSRSAQRKRVALDIDGGASEPMPDASGAEGSTEDSKPAGAADTNELES
jgi:hypothetical protein